MYFSWIVIYMYLHVLNGAVITGVHGTMNANVFASCKGVQYIDKSHIKAVEMMAFWAKIQTRI